MRQAESGRGADFFQRDSITTALLGLDHNNTSDAPPPSQWGQGPSQGRGHTLAGNNVEMVSLIYSRRVGHAVIPLCHLPCMLCLLCVVCVWYACGLCESLTVCVCVRYAWMAVCLLYAWMAVKT